MIRRDFSLVAAGAALSSRVSGANDTIATAMIGIGGRGSKLLTEAMKVDNVKFTHLCDINPTALDKALTTAARDKPQGITDYRKLLEVSSIDAVYIATPCHLHKEMAVAAIQAGKHVYCEKPLAITPEDNRAVVDAASKSKRVFQVGHNRRYSRQTAEVVRRLHAGEIGKLLFARGQYYTAQDLPHHQTWKFRRDQFGDMIVEQAVHNFDMFNWIFQGPPVRATGLGGTNLFVNDPPGRTIMDHYTISYEYPGGAHVNFSHLYYAIGDLAEVGEMVLGSDGAVVMGRRGVTFYDRKKRGPVSTLEPIKGEDSSYNSVSHFFECIRTGSHPLTGAKVGRLSALASIMGLRSMVEGRVVQWKEVDV